MVANTEMQVPLNVKLDRRDTSSSSLSCTWLACYWSAILVLLWQSRVRRLGGGAGALEQRRARWRGVDGRSIMVGGGFETEVSSLLCPLSWCKDPTFREAAVFWRGGGGGGVCLWSFLHLVSTLHILQEKKIGRSEYLHLSSNYVCQTLWSDSLIKVEM